MKKIVPFNKTLFLNNNISEITSISLEHTLSYEKNYLISGDFIITGEYKINDSSINTEKFDFKVPCDINVDDKYDLSHVVIDIDDFYYEIVDNNALNVNIDVLLDKIEDRCVEEEDNPNFIVKTATKVDTILEKTQDKMDDVQDKIEVAKEKIEQVQEKIKGFVTYRVCIVKENENLDTIINKYKVDKETLSLYNNINEIKVGDKLIIPSNE